MYLKNKKRCGKYIRSLSLILCLSLMCMPMTGMAYATEVDGDAEPAVDGISDMAEIPEEVLSLETESHMEPTLDSMKEPALEPETTVPVEDPASETSPDPTGENIEPETPAEATETPTVEADYELDVDFPIGWYDEPVTLAIRIDDVNSVGWQKVEAALTDEADAERMDLTEQLEEYGSAEYTVRDNGIVYFFITDSVGVEHTETLNVGFFDFDPPEIRAGIDGAMLHVEAFDECSRMAGIYINDGLYTTLQEAELDIRIDNVKDELFFYIQGEDMLGNLTNYVVLANPFYVEEKTEPIPEPDEDDRHDIHCSEDCDCRKPAAQMGSTGNTGASGGSVPVTQKPVTPEKSAPPEKSPAGDEKKSENNDAITTEPTTIEKGEPFSSDGSAVTRDLLYDKYTNKQFITVTTRSGETLYLVIDYDKPTDEDGEQYETYFLNLVDESDLMALVEDEAAAPVCTCKDKCAAGAVNMSCEICKNNMTECAGKETVQEPEPTEDPEPEPEEKSSGSGGILLVVLLLALGGGGALYWFKFRKEKPNTKGPVDLDDYDYGDEDDEEYETESDDAGEEEIQ